MSLLAASNFTAEFDTEDEQLVREVLEAYRQEDLREQLKAGRQRQAAGQSNSGDHFFSVMGAPTMRLTVDDYWRQQVTHNAMGDPDLWRWFRNRREGEYSRVKARNKKLVIGFTGNKRETIRFT